uniref:Uncharacterized protein n=1 Tax=Anopheles dirus TaxID=7168 RepID=A0A182MXZ6_9DIPT
MGQPVLMKSLPGVEDDHCMVKK